MHHPLADAARLRGLVAALGAELRGRMAEREVATGSKHVHTAGGVGGRSFGLLDLLWAQGSQNQIF